MIFKKAPITADLHSTGFRGETSYLLIRASASAFGGSMSVMEWAMEDIHMQCGIRMPKATVMSSVK